MAAKSFDDVLQEKQLEKRIFVFGGREDFLKERAITKFLEKFVKPEDVGDNLRRLDGKNSSKQDIFGFLNQFSFNESFRVLVVKEIEGFSQVEKKEIWETLGSHPLPVDSVLFFLSRETAAADGFQRKLVESCERFDFWPPFENQFPAWISNEAREMGLQMANDASEQLLELIGPDLTVLHQEVVKMSLQLGRGGKVTASYIRDNVGFLRQDTVFDLIDFFGYRKLPAVLRTTETLLQMGEQPNRVWAIFLKTLRDFRLFHDLRVDRPDLMEEVFEHLRALSRLHGKTDFRANQERKRLIGIVQVTVKNWPVFLLEKLSLDNANSVKKMIPAVNFTRDELVRAWPEVEKMDADLKSFIPNQKLLLQEFFIRFLTGNWESENSTL